MVICTKEGRLPPRRKRRGFRHLFSMNSKRKTLLQALQFYERTYESEDVRENIRSVAKYSVSFVSCIQNKNPGILIADASAQWLKATQEYIKTSEDHRCAWYSLKIATLECLKAFGREKLLEFFKGASVDKELIDMLLVGESKVEEDLQFYLSMLKG